MTNCVRETKKRKKNQSRGSGKGFEGMAQAVCPLCHYPLVLRLTRNRGPVAACPCQDPQEHWQIGPDFRMPPGTPGEVYQRAQAQSRKVSNHKRRKRDE